jgi:hypothetical protein
MVNGALNMKHLYKALSGALLVIGLANIVPTTASAGSHWDTVCNCMRPDSEYNTRHYVRAPAQVNTHTRVVDHTNVVKRTNLIQENRLIVHVRPVINREVVVHRQNTLVRNITLHKVNTTNKVREEYHHETINRHVPGSTRVVNEHHNVRGVDCNCGPGGSRYDGERVSYRY